MRSPRQRGGNQDRSDGARRSASAPTPGKRTLTQSLPAAPATLPSLDESVASQPISVAIPMAPGAQREAEPPGSARGPQAAGAPQSIGDIEGEPIVNNRDSVAATIGFTGSITRGGVALNAGEFGRTDSSPSLRNVRITQGSGAFHVTADYQLLTRWDTRHGTGPDGQRDVPSENAAVLTAANYRTAVSDLTPNMSDEGGRPPRTAFWAQDLTERHEQLHAREHQRTGRDGLQRALRWLRTQTASNQTDVENHLRGLQTRIVQYILANGAGSVGELHAYGDGAPLYRARARAIQRKGDGGGYS